MATSDIIALIGVIIFFLQGVLIAWYSWETYHLRKDAAKQNELILDQVKNSTEQNKLINAQLKVMTDGLQFQRECIDEEDEPALHLQVFYKDESCHKISLQNIKENVLFVEFKTNDPTLSCCRFEQHARQFISSGSTGRQIYLAAVYKTYRGKLKHKVFSYFTGDQFDQIKEEAIGDHYKNWRVVGRPVVQ